MFGAHRIAGGLRSCCPAAVLLVLTPSSVPGYVAVTVCVPRPLCRGLHMCLGVNMRCECEHEV